ncbi:MAG: GIY-YIG nuclease family protein [Sulfurovaceae bacterium]|nr:GIY-YIG nuclease family protein [Sulfurovaceae bacterium]
MAKFLLDDILDNDPLGLLGDVKAKNPIVTADDRLVASFEEVNIFFDEHGHEPQKSNDMNERGLYSRLEGLREDVNKSNSLKKYDRFNLLIIEEEIKIESIDDILNDDIFALLNEDEVDIFTLKNIPKKTTMPDYVASRKSCKDFDRFEQLFITCQKDLKTGKRELIKFQNEWQIKKGYYFILKGVLLYIADVGDIFESSGKKNARLYVVFENGTESDMLLRSLSAELYKDGKRVTEYDETELDGLYGVTYDDKPSGYIYVLKSLSRDDRITTKKNLYKIGFSKDDVKERIKNAKNEPTYLMADVTIVDVYQCFNMNSQKLEQLLHKFFGKVCLNIEIFDREGKGHFPREWFVVPLDMIDEVVGLIVSGKIVGYRYDYEEESIKDV